MSTTIFYVIIGALGTGLWNVFISSASRQMHPLLGALITELTAFSAGALIFLPMLGSGFPKVSLKAVIMCMLAGLSVLLADFFILKAYKQGMPISIGGPIIIGGSIVVVTLMGVFLGEKITWLKAVSILMIVCGASILGSLSR
ncbi:MAG: EamA family transporter [Desulfobacterales bacterium]|jgi:transporter family protein|nr:EamA family transporter [Desulfobacterales bacterium]